MKRLTIYTDGSCLGNPGPGGWCAIILEDKNLTPIKILKGGEKETTNNRMEMSGVIFGLKHILKNFSPENVEIILDSSLVVNTINLGWKKKANLDLWAELDKLNEQTYELTNGNLKYSWVRGHNKNRFNEECDKHAQSEANKFKKK